jgi:hypothetical protein
MRPETLMFTLTAFAILTTLDFLPTIAAVSRRHHKHRGGPAMERVMEVSFTENKPEV